MLNNNQFTLIGCVTFYMHTTCNKYISIKKKCVNTHYVVVQPDVSAGIPVINSSNPIDPNV